VAIRLSKRLQASVLALATCASLLGAPAVGCGYDNPDDIAQYEINIRYPKAMYVRAAVADAERDGLLPRGASHRAALDPFDFYRTTTKLQRFGKRLARMRGSASGAGISLVLLDVALWTRYQPAADGYIAHVHAEGPAKGDLVLITEVPVLTALLDGGLSMPDAIKAELVRFYGPEMMQHEARRNLLEVEKR
jgi:hypothetical protein